ncbi:MAG: hypothetical protein WA924_10970 [Burkholderiaceae bacterium]
MRKDWLLSIVLAGMIAVAFYYFEGQNALKNPDTPAPKVLAPPATVSIPKTPQAVPKVGINPTPRDGEIVKCTVNGKITYSNTGCEPHQKQERLELVDSAGIVSPSRAQIDATLARSRQERQRELAGGGKVMTIGRTEADQLECESLQAHIARLDAVARQPQYAKTQDWITEERRKATNRQNALHC